MPFEEAKSSGGGGVFGRISGLFKKGKKDAGKPDP
jgi:hypothetical protein